MFVSSSKIDFQQLRNLGSKQIITMNNNRSPRPGRQQLYQHFGQKPQKPINGWNVTYATLDNPDFAFLVNDVVAKSSFDQAAALQEEPHKIYNQHQQLYRINPWKFPDFLRKAILKYNNHRMSQSSDSSSISSNPTTADSSTPKMSSAKSASSSIPQSVHIYLTDMTRTANQYIVTLL